MATKKQAKNTKKTIKYLSFCRDAKIIKPILRSADKSLVKAICNAAYNVVKGEIPLNRQNKRPFARYRREFAALNSPKKSLISKQKAIQKGGAFSAIIPIVLSTVFGTLGTALFNRK